MSPTRLSANGMLMPNNNDVKSIRYSTHSKSTDAFKPHVDKDVSSPTVSACEYNANAPTVYPVFGAHVASLLNPTKLILPFGSVRLLKHHRPLCQRKAWHLYKTMPPTPFVSLMP